MTAVFSFITPPALTERRYRWTRLTWNQAVENPRALSRTSALQPERRLPSRLSTDRDQKLRFAVTGLVKPVWKPAIRTLLSPLHQLGQFGFQQLDGILVGVGAVDDDFKNPLAEIAFAGEHGANAAGL